MVNSLKRISILIMALALTFILFACADNSDSLTTLKSIFLDLSVMPTSGSFTAGGYSQDTKVFNFMTGGENESETHSLGEFDLRQYDSLIAYYGNDSQATDIGRLALQTVSGVELASAKCELASGWQDTAAKVVIDMSALRNKEELILSLKDFKNGIVVYKIELVYSNDLSTRLPYSNEEMSLCGNGSDISTFAESDYHKYLDACRYYKESGFVVYNQSEKNGNNFTTLTRGSEMVHVYRIAFKNEISAIYSPTNGANLPQQKSIITKGDVPTTITQIKGNGDEVMGYVIQLDDGSFLLYDGGNAECAEELLNTMNNMKKSNDIIVRGWVLTVNDEAHIGCFKEIAAKHSDEIKLERIFAAPVNRDFAAKYNRTYLSEGLTSDVAKFEGAKICYVHTGMEFNICNVKLEILFTPEEIYATDLACLNNEADGSGEAEFGNTSLVSRIITQNTKVLMLSDCGMLTARRMGIYYNTYMKSDICQAGQHGKGDMPLYIYNIISAPVIYYPTTKDIYDTDPTNRVVREVLLKNPVTQKVVLLDSEDSTISLDEVIAAPENTELVEAYQYTTTDGETVKYYFDVTLEEASEYTKELLADGFVKYSGFSLGDNQSVTYVKNFEMIHVCLYRNEKRFTVVKSEKGAATLPTKREWKKGNVVTSVTQLKTEEVDGMGYVIQLSDGSFVIYDGGNKNKDGALNLWNLLNELKPADTSIIIRAWIITSPFVDHYGVFSAFSETYASQVTLETVMKAPVPESLLEKTDGYMQNGLKEDVAKFEDAKICNLFPGMAFEYCDVAFEIFETYQDAFILSTTKNLAENISVVSRIQTVSAKMLILGDAGVDQLEHMAFTWGEYIRSDMCQVSNNGKESCPAFIYRAIKPNVVWYPCASSEIESLPEKADKIYKALKNIKNVEYIFFRDTNNEKAILEVDNGY